jgi:hypothetical protein
MSLHENGVRTYPSPGRVIMVMTEATTKMSASSSTGLLAQNCRWSSRLSVVFRLTLGNIALTVCIDSKKSALSDIPRQVARDFPGGEGWRQPPTAHYPS